MTLKTCRVNGTLTDTASGAVAFVGSGDILADSSDSTYFEGNPSPHAVNGGIETLSSYDAGDPIHLHIRMSMESTDHSGSSSQLFVFLQDGHPSDDSGDFYVGQFSVGWNTAAAFPHAFDGAPQEVTLPLTAAPGFSIDDCVTLLESGGGILAMNVLRILDADELSVKVYEAWIEVGSLSECYRTLHGGWTAEPDVTAITVVGDPGTALWDGSDDTYIDQPTGPDNFLGYMSLPAVLPSLDVEDIAVSGRISGGVDGETLAVRIVDNGGTFYAETSVPFNGSSTPTDFTHVYTDADYALEGSTFAAAVAAIKAGTARMMFVGGTGPARIQEASVQVYHRCVTSTHPPQLRKYPNPNIGPTRQWPRPRRGITGIR